MTAWRHDYSLYGWKILKDCFEIKYVVSLNENLKLVGLARWLLREHCVNVFRVVAWQLIRCSGCLLGNC